MLPASSNATAQNPAATVPGTSSASTSSTTTTAAPRVRSISNADNAALLRLDTISTANKFLKAVADGDINTAKKSILEGASVDLTDSGGNTALAIAARNGDLGMMEALLKLGADANGSPKSALQRLVGGVSMPTDVRNGLGMMGVIAAFLGFTSVGSPVIGLVAGGLTFLAIKAGAAETPSCCPLIMAAQHGQKKAVERLIQAGAIIDFTDSNRHNAVRKAAEHGHTDTLKALLKAGARVDLTDNADQTTLMIVAKLGHQDMVNPLCEAGANVNYTDRRGRTALILAAENNQTKTVKALLGKSAKVDHSARYSDGGDPGETIDDGTALIFAARNNRIGPIQELLEAGADVRFKPLKGKDAFEIAKMKGYEEAAQILREAYYKALG